MSSISIENPTSITLLAVVIAFLGSYTAISFCEQLRIVNIKGEGSKKYSQQQCLFLITISLGGTGIWCMHFVAMSGAQFFDSDGNRIEKHYNSVLTVVSLLLVLFFTFLGIYIGSQDLVFCKSKREIVELLVNNNRKLTLTQIRNMKTLDILWLIISRSLGKLFLGSLLAATGIIVMHYVGMAAIEFPGTIEWKYEFIILSVFIAFIASSASFWILFRFLSLYPSQELYRLLSASLMAIAVCGVHYTGMRGATFNYDPENQKTLPGGSTDNDTAFYSALVWSFFALWVLNMILVGKMRIGIQAANKYLSKAESTISRISVEPHSRNDILIRDYWNQRNILKEVKVNAHRYMEDDLESNLSKISKVVPEELLESNSATGELE